MSAADSGDDVRASAEARVGLVLNDKWTLEKLLGVGAMGAVYAGLHRNGARGAIKILHAPLAREAALRERFLREGYAANRVDHPGAVKVLDDDTVASGPCEGSPYLVMELLVGESLQDRLVREEPVREREFLLVASAVLAVLEKAHANAVVHRDLKPENIFLLAEDATPDDGSLGSLRIPGRPRVKVLDFGLARLLDAASNTHHGMALGTPSYMSPEQASGKNEDLDGRTDLFSLAATGFRLVAGRRVHEGAQHVIVQVANMASLPAPRIKSVAPHVTFPFARVIDRALQFKREDRYADATEMRADVEKALVEIEEIARNPTLADIPDVPEVPQAPPAPPPSASLPTVKVGLPPSASSLKIASPPPLPSSKKIPAATDANAPAQPAPGTPSEPATEPAIATELEKEPVSEPAPKRAGVGAAVWIIGFAFVGVAALAAWVVTRGPESAAPSPSTSATASASGDANDAAPIVTAITPTPDARDAGNPVDANVVDASEEEEPDASETVVELDASLDDAVKVAPVASTSAIAPKPHPKASAAPKPYHPSPKPSAKPAPKKQPPPPHHWF